MRVAGYVFGALLVLLGVIFCAAAASTGLWPRWVLGGILLVAGFVLFAVIRLKPRPTVVTHRMELTGDMALEELTCKRCSGHLDSKSVSLRAGALFVSCPYCGAEYQMEEEPKW